MSTLLGDHLLPARTWRSGAGHWALWALTAVAVLACFFGPLRFMVATWIAVEEYSYGWFVPPIVAFLVWQKAGELRREPPRGDWSGLALIALALVMRAIGEASAIRLFGQHGFVMALFGLAVCALGWRGTRIVAVPLAMLALMIPLPQFALRELSQGLQLVSSQLGVALIRLFDISVFLEGNVIDLGSYQLQVVEACSGLRYLFPLAVLGVLAAYLFRAPPWQRMVVVASTVPLTIVINSLRIGLIGVSVEHWGREMAEGLLHDFEGGFMFLICMALLIGEIALFARLGGRRLRDALAIEVPTAGAPRSAAALRIGPLVAATAMLALAGALSLAMPSRAQGAPPRSSFTAFPLELEGGWHGRTEHLDPEVLSVLAVDDYLLADYARPGAPAVNFYAAYYAAQSGGESSHSPRTCIPGGGWAITELREAAVPLAGTSSLVVNRALIQKGEHRQLVYYWFRQRGRALTDEFEVKWLILRDGIVRGRSDGALLRLVTPIAAGEDAGAADARLAAFAAQLQPRLAAYVPD